MQIIKVDLHIHTPASKCYKGPREDDEYIRIIKRAAEENLKIIAITDHNSIEGYEKLIEQRERIKVETEIFKTLNDSKKAKDKIKEGEKILNIFESILILPGIEFEVNNGVHMLVIFNPETDITTIKDFLKNGGYDADSFGKEDDVFSKWSLFDLYNESVKYDCLIIDAHTDSNKGIFSTIRSGTPRIHAFTDKSLVGICYNSEKQKKNIRDLLLSPNYTRATPVAFLKSSDAHKIDEIGKEYTYFCLKKIEWYDFKESFSNPDECIFTSRPNTKRIISSLANSKRCIFISALDESSVIKIAEAICALSNSNGGYIVIGADSVDLVNGIEIKDDSDIDKIKELFDSVSKKAKKEYIPNIYPLRESYYIFVVKVDSADELIDVEDNGIIFYYSKERIVKLNANQIQQVLSRKIETKYQQHISRELINIKKSVSAIDTYLKSQPILSSYCKNSIPIHKYLSSIEIQESIKLTPEQRQALVERYKEQGNGCCKGNIMYIDGVINPRLKDACLRITPPKFTLKGVKKVSPKKYLYIIPGGAVFYTESELNYHNNDDYSVLRLETSSDYSIKFLCAFLKSSFFLWYLKNKFGDLDFWSSKIFNRIDVPLLHLDNPKENDIITTIESNFDNIIELEKKFLKTDWNTVDDNGFEEYVNQHNEKTKIYFKKIDDAIFDLLKIKEDDKAIIKESLRANYIYIPE